MAICLPEQPGQRPLTEDEGGPLWLRHEQTSRHESKTASAALTDGPPGCNLPRELSWTGRLDSRAWPQSTRLVNWWRREEG